jgi:hypothetical protein
MSFVRSVGVFGLVAAVSPFLILAGCRGQASATDPSKSVAAAETTRVMPTVVSTVAVSASSLVVGPSESLVPVPFDQSPATSSNPAHADRRSLTLSLNGRDVVYAATGPEFESDQLCE